MRAWRFRSPRGQDRGLELGLGPGAAYVPDGRRAGPARGRRGGGVRGLSRGSRPRRFLPQSSRCLVLGARCSGLLGCRTGTSNPQCSTYSPTTGSLLLQSPHLNSKWHRRPPSGSDQKPGVILDSPLSHLPHRPDQRKSCPVSTISKRLSCFLPHHLSRLLPPALPGLGQSPLVVSPSQLCSPASKYTMSPSHLVPSPSLRSLAYLAD